MVEGQQGKIGSLPVGSGVSLGLCLFLLAIGSLSPEPLHASAAPPPSGPSPTPPWRRDLTPWKTERKDLSPWRS